MSVTATRTQTLTDSPVHRRRSRRSTFVEEAQSVLTKEASAGVTKNVRVPSTHPDGFGLVVEAREMFLHPDKVMNISLQVAPPENILGRRLKDGQVRLDASHLPSLLTISGELTPNGPTVTALTTLDLSGSGLQAVDHLIFSCCPGLRDLSLRRCAALLVVTSLETALNLRQLRLPNCSALHTVECSEEGMVAAPRLELLDLHGCVELRDEDIWDLVKDRLGGGQQIPVRGVPLEFMSWCPSKHSLVPNEVGMPGPWLEGATIRCEICCAEIPKHGLVRSCLVCNFDACERCCRKDFYRPAPYLVWPSTEGARDAPEELGLGPQVTERFRLACSEGVRLRLQHALEWSRGPWSLGSCSARRIKDIQAEIRSALKRAEEDSRLDLPLWRAVMASESNGGAAHYLQGKTFKCPYNCGAEELKAGSEEGEDFYLWHIQHLCPEGKEFCPESGLHVRRKHLELHLQVKKEIDDALATWDAAWLKAALKAGDGSTCDGCRMPRTLISSAEAVQWELKQKQKLVEPALAKKTLEINFRTKEINLLGEIAFESRAPPDATATYDPAAEHFAQAILDDLATVMKAYKVHFIVEGQCGGGNPPEFWQELADNRAELICEGLESRGVSREFLHPRGNPAGAPKVVIIALGDSFDPPQEEDE
eukprot:gnl/MRDRNA2_/MRDRNA2_106749_c0_seq1.p1 gnl/MRDRNA2_/MRDRNA2_106749_c0~~gnl/MRDRNA2_/MRDRNA2_106749_c0_seq1.p1  ORF type:complete len:651 (+),score=114.02 gnl/MRDRNA2_/MRDRNA2_106749_c0_seq1:127-2079(+)